MHVLMYACRYVHSPAVCAISQTMPKIKITTATATTLVRTLCDNEKLLGVKKSVENISGSHRENFEGKLLKNAKV